MTNFKSFFCILLVISFRCFAQENVGIYGNTQSKEAKKYFDKAVDLFHKEDYKAAEKLLLKAINSDEKYVEAYDEMGLSYHRMNEFDKAIDYYKKSITLYPQGFIAHVNLAAVYADMKNYPAAESEYQEAIKINPGSPDAYAGLANIKILESKYDEALVHSKKAMEIYDALKSPGRAEGQYQLGVIYYYLKDDKTALKYIRLAKNKGIEINPKIAKDLGL